MMRYIGPLTIAPTIALIGLDLFSTVADNSEGHWGIAIGYVHISNDLSRAAAVIRNFSNFFFFGNITIQ